MMDDDDVDFELEVADLRTGQTRRPPPAPTHAPSHQSGVTTPSPPLIADDSLDEIAVERLPPGAGDRAQVPLPRWPHLSHLPHSPHLSRLLHLAPRQARRLRGVLVGTALLGVFGGLLLSLPATQQSISGLLRM